MLNGCAYALSLHPLDIADRDPRGEERVLAEVFEVAAIHRGAVDIHARTEHEVHAPGTSVAADLGADSLGQLRIPSGGKRNPACHCCCGTVVANAQCSFSHFETRTTESGNVPEKKIRDSGRSVDLLRGPH